MAATPVHKNLTPTLIVSSFRSFTACKELTTILNWQSSADRDFAVTPMTIESLGMQRLDRIEPGRRALPGYSPEATPTTTATATPSDSAIDQLVITVGQSA